MVNKPNLSFKISLFAGLCNEALDFALIVLCEFGILGTAVAMALAYLIGGVFPLIYFMQRRENVALKLEIMQEIQAIKDYHAILLRICVNG